MLKSPATASRAIWLLPLGIVVAGALGGNAGAVGFGAGLAGGLSLSGSV